MRKTIKIDNIEGYITKEEYNLPGFEYTWIDGLYVYKKINKYGKKEEE